MKLVHPVDASRTYMVRLPFGSDLIKELTAFCRKHQVRLGRVSGLGAAQRATIAFYHQTEQHYEKIVVNEPMEIVSLFGNISIKDGQPFVHAHIVLARPDGSTIGGHLSEGTPIFAAECFIESFSGQDLVRGSDEKTGLQLWMSQCGDAQ